MATIIDGAIWTLTKEAADYLVEKEVLIKCGADHNHPALLEIDYPVYHLRHKRGASLGATTLHTHIAEAEKAVEVR